MIYNVISKKYTHCTPETFTQLNCKHQPMCEVPQEPSNKRRLKTNKSVAQSKLTPSTERVTWANSLQPEVDHATENV